MMGNWGWGWSEGYGMGFGWLFMVAFWVLVAAGIVALVRWLSAIDGPQSSASESPLELLQKRYARGEIGREEYEQKRADLAG
jgi:putative membrane protein